MADHEFEQAVTQAPPLHYWLERLATSLSNDLKAKGKLCQRVSLQLTLENRKSLEHEGVLRTPTNTPVHLVNRLHELLEQFTVKDGVVGLVIRLDKLTYPIPYQMRLFEDHLAQRHQLEATLRHIMTRYGENHIQHVRVDHADAYTAEQRYRFEQLEPEI
jgi:hypothetical protein